MGVWRVEDDSHFVFCQKLLGEDGIVRRSIVMVKQPGLFSPKFGGTSSHVFKQSLQNVAVEPGIHSLAWWDSFFVLPQLLHRWRHQFRMFWIPPRIVVFCIVMTHILVDYCQHFKKPIDSSGHFEVDGFIIFLYEISNYVITQKIIVQIFTAMKIRQPLYTSTLFSVNLNKCTQHSNLDKV
jgi:hypothetical protein